MPNQTPNKPQTLNSDLRADTQMVPLKLNKQELNLNP